MSNGGECIEIEYSISSIPIEPTRAIFITCKYLRSYFNCIGIINIHLSTSIFRDLTENRDFPSAGRRMLLMLKYGSVRFNTENKDLKFLIWRVTEALFGKDSKIYLSSNTFV